MDIKKINIEKIVSVIILIGLVVYNLISFAPELTAQSDPNDNAFHYALVDEAVGIWKQIFAGKLSPFYLFDHFNERWNEGFALPVYYTHLPQAIMALLSLMTGIAAYDLFNAVKYLMLALLPVSFFVSARILGQPYLLALILSLMVRLIFTDGLYGIDVSSFLWRGWGISAQLIALFFLPPAWAYTVKFLQEGKNLLRSILFNVIVFQAHSGVFYMLALSYPMMLAINIAEIRTVAKRFIILALFLFLFLAYYLIPFSLQGQYRSFSYWDSLWKFNSFGTKEIVAWFLDGKLFDFNRPAILTLLVAFGVFWGFLSRQAFYRYLSLAFLFYLVMFFGRFGLLGKAIDLIPGLSEFHLHRFIVMVQVSGIYMAAWFFYSILGVLERGFAKVGKNQFWTPIASWLLIALVGTYLFIALDKPVSEYVKHNRRLIAESNIRHQQDIKDYEKLVARLSGLPHARIYAGRPGNWGRDFKVGDTPIYMSLSRDGFAVVGFAPESWSPNADYDQFFNDSDRDIFNLYNVGYLIYPESQKPPKFAKLIAVQGKYRLYKTNTANWFTLGTSSTVFTGKKTYFYNMVKLWTGSNLLKQNEYPTISFNEGESYGRQYQVRMVDLNNYEILFSGGATDKGKNIWEEMPLYISPVSLNEIKWEKGREQVAPQKYAARFKLQRDCGNCVAILKQTYHPNWRVAVNGQVVTAFPVFPFYIGIPITTGGEYKIEAEYRPGGLKVLLLLVQGVVLVGFVVYKLYKSRRRLIL